MKRNGSQLALSICLFAVGCGGAPALDQATPSAGSLPTPLRASLKSHALTDSPSSYAYLEGYSDSVDYAGTTYSGSAGWAAFWKSDNTGTSCAYTSSGSCYYVDCSGATGGGTLLDGGTVSVAHQLSMKADSSNYFSAENDTTALWSKAGDPVSFSVSGSAQVPAISGTVTAPGDITITAPALTAQSFTDNAGNTNLSFDRTSDLDVAWTQSGASDYFDVGLSSTTNPSRYVVCYFPPTQQAGVIPASLLQKLDAGSAALWAEASNWKEQTPSGWDVWMGADTTPHTSDGIEYGAYVQLK